MFCFPLPDVKLTRFIILQLLKKENIHMADFISQDKILKFRNAFSAFDPANSGTIRVKLLGNILR